MDVVTRRRRRAGSWPTGPGGRHLAQGLHRHPPRRARAPPSRRHTSAGVKVTGHLCSVQLPRSGRARHRQSRARHAHRLRLRSRTSSRTSVRSSGRRASAGRSPGHAGEDVIQTHGQAEGIHDVDARGVRAVRRQPADQGCRGRSRRWRPRVREGLPQDPARDRLAGHGPFREEVFRSAMAYERAFVEAGGLLAAGVDPTGMGARWPATATSGTTSCSSRPASPRSRRSRS